MSMHTQTKSAETNDATSPSTAIQSDTFAEDGTRIVLNGHVWVSGERMHGEPCFNGTRLPIYVLLHQMTGDAYIREFQEAYGDIPRERIEAVIEEACRLLTEKYGE